MGLYQTTVKEMYEDTYILPQENGNRTDVELLILSDKKCVVEITSPRPFEFGASHISIEELMKCRHQCEVQMEKETILCLDLAQRGLGTGSCGPQTLPQYALDEKKYQFSFELKIN